MASSDSPGLAASASPPSAAKNFNKTPTSWDAQDDLLLMHLKDNQKLGWKEILLHFVNRTPNACQFRWRRLKSGNLKNPPKLSQNLGGLAAAAAAASDDGSNALSRTGLVLSASRKPFKRRPLETLTPLIPPAFLPLANTTFTGYDTVLTALAGLNALSNLNPGSRLVSHLGPINTTSHPQTFDNLPRLDVPLDPQTHSAAAAGTLGGYFTDILVDPTLNLPHNQPHPPPHLRGITPRNSDADQHPPPLHNNSIIQIARDDRTSVLLTRHSVLSLPSKLMHIPHHQLTSSTLAHLPLLFGGNSILGPLGSVSGPLGLPHLALTLLSIRNGSIVGTLQPLRRLSMLVLPSERRSLLLKDLKRPEPPKDKERKLKPEPKDKKLAPIFKIPWSMEEDELLINRRRKELSFAELLILLPQRTEGEIWARIDALERLRNGHRASVSKENRRRRKSSLGLDDVDDFYDDVDSVLGGIDSDDDDDDDDVLLDVEGLPDHVRRHRKRRASSAVNPLSVRDDFRKRHH